MTILIADNMSETGSETLRRAGHDVVFAPGAKGDVLREALKEKLPRVLIVRSTRVTADMMDSGTSLELIVRAGAGYDTIDVEAASARGIYVSNCPGMNADAVAELVIGLVLALDRKIPDNVHAARAGSWNKELFAQARGIKGATLGIIGLGSIGTRVAHLGRALGMNLVGWSRSLTEERAAEIDLVAKSSPREVAADADVVTIHVAGSSDTRRLADRDFFAAMREGAFFINTSRSSVVDEEALQWALDTKDVRAAIDVMEGEPEHKSGPFSHPLAGHPNLYVTHHIGASTRQAQEAIAAEAVRVVLEYHESGDVLNCVNLEANSPATHLMTVRHFDKIGVLAAVLEEVRRAEWNVQEMENVIFKGARAACARIRFVGVPKVEVISRIEDHPDVLAVSLVAL